MATFAIVEGTTAATVFQLLENGLPLVLTGLTVTLLLEDKTGVAVVTSLTVTDAVNGKVSYAAGATDLKASLSPYKARFKIVDGTGAIKFAPSGLNMVWDVIAQ